MDGCPERNERVWLYVFGEMTEDERTSFAEHLSRCPFCRSEYRRFSAMLDKVKDAGRPPHLPPQRSDEMIGRILDRLATKARPAGSRGLLALWRPFPALAAACALVLLVSFGAFDLFHREGEAPMMTEIKTDQALSPEKMEMLEDLELLREFQTVKKLVRVLGDTSPQERQMDEDNNAKRNPKNEIESQMA